jgi:hypothetical protein
MAAARARGVGSEATAKPAFDAYAGMLLLSLLAMVAGTVLLFLDYNEYPAGKANPPPAAKLQMGAGGGGGGGAAGGAGGGGGGGVVPPKAP